MIIEQLLKVVDADGHCILVSIISRDKGDLLHQNFPVDFLVGLIHSSSNFQREITEHERIFG
jgi:hypothetical protein